MIKKTAHILILFILLVSTTGFTISKHFMGSKLYDVSIIGHAKGCCENPCPQCHDEIQFHQLKVDFISETVPFDNLVQTVDLLPIITIRKDHQALILDRHVESFVLEGSPPGLNLTPSFTQIFRL